MSALQALRQKLEGGYEDEQFLKKLSEWEKELDNNDNTQYLIQR